MITRRRGPDANTDPVSAGDGVTEVESRSELPDEEPDEEGTAVASEAGDDSGEFAGEDGDEV